MKCVYGAYTRYIGLHYRLYASRVHTVYRVHIESTDRVHGVEIQPRSCKVYTQGSTYIPHLGIHIESGLSQQRLEPDDGSYKDSNQHYMVAAVLKCRGIATNITWWQRCQCQTTKVQKHNVQCVGIQRCKNTSTNTAEQCWKTKVQEHDSGVTTNIAVLEHSGVSTRQPCGNTNEIAILVSTL